MPIPFDRLTAAHLRTADLVHFVDPHDPNYHRYLPVRPVDAWAWSASGRSPCRVLIVAVDRQRAGMQIFDLARRIRGTAAVVGNGPT